MGSFSLKTTTGTGDQTQSKHLKTFKSKDASRGGRKTKEEKETTEHMPLGGVVFANGKYISLTVILLTQQLHYGNEPEQRVHWIA